MKNFDRSEQLRLGIEMISPDGWTGGAQYVRNLIYCLASLPESEQPIVRLLGAVPDDPFVREMQTFPFVKLGSKPAVERFSGLWWRAVARRLVGKTAYADTGPSIDVTYPGFGSPLPGVAQMRWLTDLQHVYLPHFFSSEELSARADSISSLSGNPGIVVMSSKATLADFLKLCPNPVATPQVWSFCTVLTKHEAGGRNPRDTYGLPAKFAYLPNQFWAHKDHLTAFKALAQLRQRGVDLPVVCTGLEEDRRNPDHFAQLMRYLSENGLDEAVRCLGLVPRNDQIEIFRHASVVIQPSLFEGWSTVVEDTKAMGRPIIATVLSVHQEQLEGYDRAWLFRPGAADELAALLERVWPLLPPGPEPDRERMAARHTEQRSQTAARRFMSIAQSAKALNEVGRSVAHNISGPIERVDGTEAHPARMRR